MSDHQFWLSVEQFARLEPLLPNKPRGVPRVDDRRVISGIIPVIRGGLMWRDAPGVYGPPKTLYNRFIRWSRIGVFDRIFATLAGGSEATDTVMIDATHLKAHRTAASLLKKGVFWPHVGRVRCGLCAAWPAFHPARAADARPVAAGVLHDPVRAPAGGAARLRPVVPLVRRPRRRRSGMGCVVLREEPGAVPGDGGGDAVPGRGRRASGRPSPDEPRPFLGGRHADRGLGEHEELPAQG